MKMLARTLIGSAAALATATAVALALGAADPDPEGHSATPAGADRPQTQHAPAASKSLRIASSDLGRDYRFTLTALRSETAPSTASVRLQVFTFQDGAWKESDRITVGDADGFFWHPLTGRHAVCKLSTSSVGTASGAGARTGTEPAPVSVSVLVTPSIGCSPAENFQVENGKIASG